MPRTALAPQDSTRNGLALAFTAANVDGHSVLNTGKVLLYVKNGAAAAINVTVQTPGTADDGLAIADKIVSIPATGERVLGPYPPPIYGDDMLVDFSAITTVTIAALRIQ